MKTEKFSGTMENAYGKPLATPINFEGEYEAYENKAEVEAANDLLKDQEVVDFRNTQRKANARQKAMQAQLDAAGIPKPSLENDSQLRLKTVYKTFIAKGKSHQEARDLAASMLGDAWEDGE